MWHPYRPPQPVTGIALPFLHVIFSFIDWNENIYGNGKSESSLCGLYSISALSDKQSSSISQFFRDVTIYSLVSAYQATWCHISAYLDLHVHHRENPRSQNNPDFWDLVPVNDNVICELSLKCFFFVDDVLRCLQVLSCICPSSLVNSLHFGNWFHIRLQANRIRKKLRLVLGLNHWNRGGSEDQINQGKPQFINSCTEVCSGVRCTLVVKALCCKPERRGFETG
jgi:hypothetical protein